MYQKELYHQGRTFGFLVALVNQITYLVICCLVEGLREHNVVQISSSFHAHCAVLVDPSPSSIRQSQQASFNNKQHSDVVLIVENEYLYAMWMFLVIISQPCSGPT
jgi:hypothetical protein